MGNPSERKRQILSLLAEGKDLSVAQISKALDVSTVTVRNDLNALEESGYIVRTRGGALPGFHRSILERQRNRTGQKHRIAREAASLVEDGDTIMIEAGTTTALVARYLLGKRDVHIVTNSTLVLPYARINPSIHVTMTGGEFRPITESCVGPLAIRDLEDFHVRVAFVGTDGFDVQTGLTTHLVEGAEIVRKMSERSDRTVLVADSSKYGRAGFAKVLPLSAVSILVTDTGLRSDEKKAIENEGVAVTTV